MTGPGLASGLAQDAPPVATPGTAAAIDLAAMALLPPDLTALGMPGYGLHVGAMLTPAAQAARVAPDVGRDPTEVRAGLEAAGFRRRYELQLGLPQRPGETPPRLRAFVASYVLEYASPAGAAAGFALLEDEAPGWMEDLPEARAFAERSEVTRLRPPEQGNQPYRALDLTFQVDNLVAGVTVADLSGQEPDLAAIEALGERLLARVRAEQATPGPGLSNQALRLADEGVEFRADEYGRIAGETIPNYNETPDERAARASRYGEAIDVYGVWLGVPRKPDEQGDDLHYFSLLHRFGDAAAARAWLGGGQERVATSPNILAASVAPGAATIGDESLTLRLSIERSRGRAWDGFVIYARVGADVAQVQLAGAGEVSLAMLEELARAQAACLQTGFCPAAVAEPRQ
jgi:hypothetical protein